MIVNKLCLSVCLIVLAISACHGQKPGEQVVWKEFVSEAGKFKATFPGIPKEDIEELDAKLGKRYTHWTEVLLPHKQFAVSYTDYQSLPGMNQEQLKANYDNLRDLMLTQSNIKLVSERELWLKGRLGRELIFNGPNAVATSRMFLIGNRLYQAITTIEMPLTENEEAKKEAIRFLDSFQFDESPSNKN